jgi:hypothetical protein
MRLSDEIQMSFMNRSRLQCAVLGTAMVVLASVACSTLSLTRTAGAPHALGQPRTGASTPVPKQSTSPQVTDSGGSSPIDLTGHLLVHTGQAIYNVTYDPDRGSVVKKQLPLDMVDFADFVQSPDRRLLLASAPNNTAYTYLYEIPTGQVTRLDTYSECLGWAPGSDRFSYYAYDSGTDTWGMRVYTLATAESALLFSPPSAMYSGNFGPIEIQAQVRCGQSTWLDEERIMFQAYQGAMPSQITYGNPKETSPNTTLILSTAHQGERLASDALWSLVGTCPGGSYALLKDSGGSLYIAHQIHTIAELDALLLGDGQWYRAGFMPDSCEIYLIQAADEQGGDSGHQIYFADPQTLEQRPGPRLPIPSGFGYGWREDLVWVGDPQQHRIAMFDERGELALIDLDSGGETRLDAQGELEDCHLAGCRVLAWSP